MQASKRAKNKNILTSYRMCYACNNASEQASKRASEQASKRASEQINSNTQFMGVDYESN